VAETAPQRLALATNNAHKAGEIADLLGAAPVVLLTPADLGVRLEVVEDGDSYEANALKKARALQALTGLPTLADDSGLEVDALDGAPGIRSARFAGEDADDRENNLMLLRLLEHVPAEHRQARFVCVAALVGIGDERAVNLFRGEWEGEIAGTAAGESGFGYDPVFFLPEQGATVAELGADYKREHSHRARAFRRAAAYLKTLVSTGEELH
jgi:XTP/dITP diphosphohydrolase